MAGEQTASGHVTWKQQAGSVLQQRKIFRTSLTTRRSHFIWPGGCGQWMDAFPTVRVGFAVIHLSVTFFFHFSSSFYLSGQTEQTELPSSSSSSSLSSSFSSAAALPHCVFSPFQTFSFLPLSPSFSLCLWSVTLNLAPSICFSSFVGPALFLIKITSGFDLLWSFWSYCGYRLNSKPTTILNQPNTHRIQREGMFLLTMDQNDFFFPPLLSSIIKSSAFVTWRGRPVTHFASQPVNPHNLWIGTWRGL